MGLLDSFQSGGVDDKLDEMGDSLRSAREAIEDVDYEAAVDEIEGISDGTGCDLCESMEMNLLFGLHFVISTPKPVRVPAETALVTAINHYLGMIEDG